MVVPASLLYLADVGFLIYGAAFADSTALNTHISFRRCEEGEGISRAITRS